MNISTLNFTVVSSPKTKFSDAQVMLREFTGRKFAGNEAETIWKNVLSHKWNMSEKLGRDVGLRVASIDFIENFYHPHSEANKTKITISLLLRKALRFYFETKANPFNY